MKKLILYIVVSLSLVLSFAAGYFFYEHTKGFGWLEQNDKNVELVRGLLCELKNKRDFTAEDARKFFGHNLDSPRIYKSDSEYMRVLCEVLGGILKSDSCEYILAGASARSANSPDSNFSLRAYDCRVVCLIEDLSRGEDAACGALPGKVDSLVFCVDSFEGLLRTNIYLNGRLIWEYSKE